MRQHRERYGAVSARAEHCLAPRKSRQELDIPGTLGRIEFARKFHRIVVMKPEEHARADTKERSTDIERELPPELVAGDDGDAVLARLGDQRGEIPADQVLEFIGVNGK